MGDGCCFLNGIDLVLYCDYDEVITVDHMANNILEHLATNAYYYQQFHTSNLKQDAEGYFRFGNYCDSIINVHSTLPIPKLHLMKNQL